MNKIAVFTTAALLAPVVLAGPEADKTKQSAPKAAQRFRVGGQIEQPGSSRGFVAIVNLQSKVSLEDLKGATESIRRDRAYVFKFFTSVDEAREARMVIKVIDDPAKPSLLVAPDDSWATVNVANLVNDLKTDEAKAKFLPLRTRKQILRAFVNAAAAGGSAWKKNILDCANLRDLDYWGEFLPLDALDRAMFHMKARGLLPARVVTYRTACYEGWAPAPTNDVEKVIWDEAHEIPSDPIKIKFDPKRDK